MSIYAIADTHLAFFPESDKPMDVFGKRWTDHEDRLKTACEQMMNDDDTLIVAGDISWAIRLEDARYDLDWIHSLPGRKIMIKGNHDLWWNGITKLNSLYEDMSFLQNDCIVAEGCCICGSRGWLTPDHDDYTGEDEKIYRRETLRLEMSLEAGKKKLDEDPGIERILGFIHFPPAIDRVRLSAFHDLFREYGVRDVYYGHIHGDEAFRAALTGDVDGIAYHLISLDYLNCRPLKIS